MFVGGGHGAPARGGRLAGSFGAALDSVAALTLPDTAGLPIAATGVVTLSDPTVTAYLDVQIDLEMRSFTQTGDVNGDGTANWDDRRLHAAAWGTGYADPSYNPALDWNADGVIDQADYLGPDGAWNAFATCKADCGQQGGVVGSDGVVDNNDWIVFTSQYFAGLPDADIGGTGNSEGADGLIDNNDYIVFINWYFGTCN